jgi:hypothetical protein
VLSEPGTNVSPAHSLAACEPRTALLSVVARLALLAAGAHVHSSRETAVEAVAALVVGLTVAENARGALAFLAGRAVAARRRARNSAGSVHAGARVDARVRALVALEAGAAVVGTRAGGAVLTAGARARAFGFAGIETLTPEPTAAPRAELAIGARVQAPRGLAHVRVAEGAAAFVGVRAVLAVVETTAAGNAAYAGPVRTDPLALEIRAALRRIQAIVGRRLAGAFARLAGAGATVGVTAARLRQCLARATARRTPVLAAFARTAACADRQQREEGEENAVPESYPHDANNSRSSRATTRCPCGCRANLEGLGTVSQRATHGGPPFPPPDPAWTLPFRMQAQCRNGEFSASPCV